ncbi:ead/Ea22-like family protein [Escherichia coli]|uniref:ead/Ea22-like family protein n=1 Tax=Escherichia coli TaxID=562 RepID=UPI001C9B23C4|nr:ead/Ea22-like family protein [Escherichia coli]MBY7424887.1 ead/Ea22-like family protein [Escherichia coli]
MSVKRYEWVVCDEHSCYCDVVESAEGDMVDYEDYAALEARCAALAAENAGLNNFIKADCWVWDDKAEEYIDAVDCMPEIPATDAFLAEVRAQGVEAAIATAKNVVAQEFQYKDFETAQRVCSKFPESDLVGKVEMVEWLEDFAAQLRKGVQS